MPNWCGNTLTIRGPKEDRDAFIEGFPSVDDDATPEFIRNYIPIPEDIGDGWYDWAIENWGTKWGDCDTRIIYNNDRATAVGFSTAWSPPVAAIETISQMFPTLQFVLSYEEGGMCFLGVIALVDGKCFFNKFIEGADYEKLYPEREEDKWDEWYERGYDAVQDELARLTSLAWDNLSVK